MTLLVPWKSRRRAPVRPFSWDLGEFDRLFRDAWSDLGLEPARAVGFSPRVDVLESGADYRITAELPGLSSQEFEVCVEGDVLTLKGEKRDEHPQAPEGYRHVETRAGCFERSFRLPADVDAEKIAARHENGVLVVTLPKLEAAQPRTIPVRAS